MSNLILALFVLLPFSDQKVTKKPAVKKVEPWQVFSPGQNAIDKRLGKQRNLYDEYHPWAPPKTKAEWEKRRQEIRRQILVSNGLWPMPPKHALKPTIHGKIDRGDYTIEKVFFTSHPGHYVTGNLYRPKGRKGKLPGILCPHGHWSRGRQYDSGDKAAFGQVKKSAERHMAGARFPLQARMVQLARLGCVVFHYDMVGYADSRQIAHRAGFTDVESAMRLQNFMGLQTFNSIRALDFLISLPDVDPDRIGVTGASGGGTQTFMLCAVDPRPAVAFPAVMVSTAMQGGCICENAEYLRIGINNIAIAAMFAPKPMAMSGANDWTIKIESRGLPELRKVYSFYDKAKLVNAKARPQFHHNYNEVNRTMMYEFFNDYLKLGKKSPIREEDFWPVPPAELSVFDRKHPLPKDAVDSNVLRRYLTKISEEQFEKLLPKDSKWLKKYRELVGAAARVMLDRGVPTADEFENEPPVKAIFPGEISMVKGIAKRKAGGDAVPYIRLISQKNYNGQCVLWVDNAGKQHLFSKDGEPNRQVKKYLNAGFEVVSLDCLYTGEQRPSDRKPWKIDHVYQGFTHGYNRPLLSNRVRDILTMIGYLKHKQNVQTIHLLGTGKAGVWVLMARAMAGDAIAQTVVSIEGRGFESVYDFSDPLFLPGALKYGGLGGLAALAAPAPLTIGGIRNLKLKEKQPLIQVYRVAGGSLNLIDRPLNEDDFFRVMKKTVKKK